MLMPPAACPAKTPRRGEGCAGPAPRRAGWPILLAFLAAILAMAPTRAARAEVADAFAQAAVTPKVGATLPLDSPWRDEDGRLVRLGQYFGRRPVILAPVYYDCPNLCGIVLGSVLDALGPAGLAKAEIVAYSIDPAETPALAARSKQEHLGRRGVDPAHLHFLTGTGSAIRSLSDAAGYSFAWDPEIKQFAHASTLILVTADGRISGYLAGLGGTPQALATALDRAASGEATPPEPSFLLLCYHYLSSVGRYSGVIRQVIQVAVAGTVLAILFLVGRSLWRERRAGRP